ncbi:carbonic anhydrase 2-like isoform X2 [Liolophura sinensis]|uniref:carbonic anhydrase 2-like isoform X2 n=1 Tax=Liolophura sinensis TaxID=3198878 RepID=UPI0031598678
MEKSSVLFLCLYVVILLYPNPVQAGAGNEWGYEGANRPEKWYEEFPRCGGKKQSPINIVTDEVILNKRLGEIKFTGYDQMLTKPVLKNNGHSAQVNLDHDIFIEYGGLPYQYKAAQFHFHWGEADRRGSEHSVDSDGFPMEMHIVHYATEYANFSDAVNKPDGLAVLAIFMQVGEEEHPGFQHIVSHLDSPIHKGEEIPMEPMTLKSLLPSDTKTFYRYSGSLTTPPCYESVVWTLYPDYVTVSKDQVDLFRKYLRANAANATNEVRLVNDYRPQQPINVRLVETNTIMGLAGSGSDARATTLYLVLVSSLSCFYFHFLL